MSGIKRSREDDSSELTVKRSMNITQPDTDAINSFDYLSRLPDECTDCIWKHLTGRSLLQMSLVCQELRKKIGKSRVAMSKLTFKYEFESKHLLEHTVRRYRNIKFKQIYENQGKDFLGSISNLASSLTCLSFEGIYEKSDVGKVFRNIRRAQNSNLRIEHLTFIGNVRNVCSILAQLSASVEMFETVRFVELPPASFNRNLLESINARKVIISNMNLRNFKHENIKRQSPPLYLDQIQEFEFQASVVCHATIRGLLKYCSNLNSFACSNWSGLGYKIKQLVQEENKIALDIVPPTIRDPVIVLPEELHELIFNHLTHDELTDSSLVSRTWFDFTKKTFVEKSVYTVLELEENTKRKYESAILNLTEIINPPRLRNFMSELKLMYINISSSIFEKVKSLFALYNFPEMEALVLSCCERSPIDDFKFPIGLTSLHMTMFELRSKNAYTTEFFINFLAKTEKLKDLQFYECYGLEKLFESRIDEMSSFKLTTLRIPFYRSNLKKWDATSQIKTNFHEFLLNQKESLLELFLHRIDVKTFEILVKNVNLTSLSFAIMSGPVDLIEKMVDQKLKFNSLQEFFIPFPELRLQKLYLSLTPNVKFLHARDLDDELLQFVSEGEYKLSFLEKIQYETGYFNEEDSKILYPNIAIEQEDFEFVENDIIDNEDTDRANEERNEIQILNGHV